MTRDLLGNGVEEETAAIEKKYPLREDTEKDVFATFTGSSLGGVVRKDGAILHPQPTADPLDPLNWSWARKHIILGIVIYL
jgi:hypothetical protein